MNKYISLILMQRLLDLPYIDKPGGMVQTLKKVIPNAEGKPVVKRIPFSAVHQAPANCDLSQATALQFVPESKLKGMFYFEDNGSSPDTGIRTTSLTHWRSRLRMVVWLNQKKLTETYDITFASKVMNEMIGKLLVRSENHEYFKLLSIEVGNIAPQTASIFSDWDYNEEETQFLMPPYDFFAVDFDIRFGIPRNCIVPVIPAEDLPNC